MGGPEPNPCYHAPTRTCRSTAWPRSTGRDVVCPTRIAARCRHLLKYAYPTIAEKVPLATRPKPQAHYLAGARTVSTKPKTTVNGIRDSRAMARPAFQLMDHDQR
jgi:hypothetical protein